MRNERRWERRGRKCVGSWAGRRWLCDAGSSTRTSRSTTRRRSSRTPCSWVASPSTGHLRRCRPSSSGSWLSRATPAWWWPASGRSCGATDRAGRACSRRRSLVCRSASSGVTTATRPSRPTTRCSTTGDTGRLQVATVTAARCRIAAPQRSIRRICANVLL